MSTLKLQPRRRHLAAAITIALTSAFIAIAVLAVGFVGEAVKAQVTGPVQGASALVQPAFTSEGDAASASPETIGKVDGADGAFYKTDNTFAIALDEGETGKENPLDSKGTFVKVDAVRPGVDAHYVEGKAPSGDHEVAVDTSFAKKRNLKVGSQIGVQSLDSGQTLTFTVAGISQPQLAQVLNPGGTLTFGTAGIDTLTALGGDASEKASDYYAIAVVAKPGVSEEELVSNLKAAGYDAATVTEFLQEANLMTLTVVTMLSALLAGFVLIAIATSALVVTNSFAVTMAQRRRSFALARALGAKRRQAMWAIVRDALLVGFIGSILGIVLAYLAWWALLLVGRSTYSEALPVVPGLNIFAILVPILASLILAVCASVFPAISASRVKPLEALRPAEIASGKHASLIRTIFASAVVALGVVVSLGSFVVEIVLKDSEFMILISMLCAFLGCLTILVGVIGLLPALIPPVAKLGNALASALGFTSARFAFLNLARHPKRTGITMSALIIGTTLMATMASGAVTAQNTFEHDITDRVPVDTIIAATDLPAGFLEKVQKTEGVDTAREVPTAELPFDEGAMTVYAPSAEDLQEVATSNSIEVPPPGEMHMGKARAQRFHVHDGEKVTVKANDGSPREVTVRVKGKLSISLVNPETLNGLGIDVGKAVFVKFASPDSPQRAHTTSIQLTGALSELANQLPPETVTAQSFDGAQREVMATVIQTLLTITVALLAVAVVVAIVGVANTLSLSVIERSSEYALMRALGTSKGAIRAMLVWEGIFIAFLGSLVGVLLGTAFGMFGVRSLLAGEFDFYPAIPWLYLLVILLAGLVAGVLASILPGMRASATAPAQALAQRDE